MLLVKRHLYRVIVDLILIYPILVTVSYLYGNVYGRLMTPLYANALHFYSDDYFIKELRIVQDKHQRLVEAVLLNRDAQLIGGRVLPGQVDVTVSTLLGHTLQHVILMFTIVFVWLVFRIGKTWIYKLGIICLALSVVFAFVVLLIGEFISINGVDLLLAQPSSVQAVDLG